MPRLRVVLDTNVYRSLSKETFAELRGLEAQHSVIAHASFWVVAELLSHLAAPNDESFAAAWAAVRRLYQHCVQYDGARYITRFVADNEDHLCHTLFGRSLPGRDADAELYGHIVGVVGSATSIAELAPVKQYLTQIQQHVAAAEAQFRADVWNGIVLRLVPTATTWSALAQHKSLRDEFIARIQGDAALRFAASVLVAKAASQLQIALDDARREQLVDRVIELYELPLRFYNSILGRVAANGYNLDASKNVNSLWDMQICYSTSPKASLEGSPLWLITGDSAVLKAANDCGAGGVVRDMEAYTAALSTHTVED